MKEQHKSHCCWCSWDVFEVDYTLKVALNGKSTCCSVRPCSHRASCFTDDKASRIAVAVDVDCSFVNKRYRDLDFLRKVRV
jgi:hypothetical protein